MAKINLPIAIFWFRRDLRLADNVGLYHALQCGLPVLPLFIFDTEILSQLDNKADMRVDFIYQAISSLNEQLKEKGSSLYVKTGKPLEIFEQLLKEYNITKVYTNRDYEPSAIIRDTKIKTLLESKSVDFLTFKDQVIFEYDEVLKANGEPYTIYTPYSRVWKQQLSEKYYQPFSIDYTRLIDDQHFKTPSLEEIGFEKTDLVFSKPHIDKNLILNYEETRNFPAIKGSTELSVHLRFGTVSVRELVAIAVKTSEAWLNELIWREFFMSILMHFPQVTTASFKKKYDEINWRNNEIEFARWCEGKTGYPIVDAGMRQLNETGWMHNRVRMITASFLTKHLLVDWHWGEAYFAAKLLDYDLAANNGNWQWAAGCGCDAAPYFRVFNPTEQTKKFDPELKYIRRWVKEFDTLDYPQPIVEHTFARNRALEVYKRGLNTF